MECLMKQIEQVTGAAGELQRIRMSGVYTPQPLTISRAISNNFLPLSSYPSLLSFRISYPARLYQRFHFRTRMGMSSTCHLSTERPIAAAQRV